MSLGSDDRINEEVERAINYARTKGVSEKTGEPYYFIDLVLVDAGAASGDPRAFCVSGIRELTPLPPRPDKNGAMTYAFDENQGGATRFRPDGAGVWRYSMWDDPEDHNRRFLASHWDSGFWDIEDLVMEQIIFDLYEEMKADIEKKSKTPLQKKLVSLESKYKAAKPEDRSGIVNQMQGLVKEHENEVRPTKRKSGQRIKKRSKYRTEPTAAQLSKSKERPEREAPLTQPKQRQSVVRVDE